LIDKRSEKRQRLVSTFVSSTSPMIERGKGESPAAEKAREMLRSQEDGEVRQRIGE
jgi:hypothetical protein